MSIAGLDAPDFCTIPEFRKRHLFALGELFNLNPVVGVAVFREVLGPQAQKRMVDVTQS